MKKFTIIIAIILIGCIWVNSTERTRLFLAGLYDKRTDIDKKIRLYEKVLRKSEVAVHNPLIAAFRKNLTEKERISLSKTVGDYYFEKGNKFKAVKYYTILKESSPSDLGLYLNLYVLTMKPGQLPEIILEHKDKGLKDALPLECIKTPSFKFHFGLGFFKRKRYEEAKNEFLQLASQYPYLWGFHYCLAYCLEKTGLQNEAETEYRIARDLNVNYIPFLEEEGAENAEDYFDFICIWDFGTGHGNILKDSSGNELNGIIEGARWEKCPLGFALYFDGEDDTVIMPPGKDFNLDGRDFTIMVSFQPANQGKHRFLYKKGTLAFQLHRIEDRWISWITDAEGRKRIVMRTPIENKQYIAIQRVAQRSKRDIWLFDKNGLIKRAEGGIAETVGSDGREFALSRRGWSSKNSEYFRGYIYKVIIFNRALTENEIMNLYNTEVARCQI